MNNFDAIFGPKKKSASIWTFPLKVLEYNK